MRTLPSAKVEKLRTRLDPETLRLFTEVIDPVTREALYRVPPTPISETAEREGEFLARYERMASALALEPLPRPRRPGRRLSLAWPRADPEQ